MDYDVRKWLGLVEEIEHEGGLRAQAPLRAAVGGGAAHHDAVSAAEARGDGLR